MVAASQNRQSRKCSLLLHKWVGLLQHVLLYKLCIIKSYCETLKMLTFDTKYNVLNINVRKRKSLVSKAPRPHYSLVWVSVIVPNKRVARKCRIPENEESNWIKGGSGGRQAGRRHMPRAAGASRGGTKRGCSNFLTRNIHKFC